MLYEGYISLINCKENKWKCWIQGVADQNYGHEHITFQAYNKKLTIMCTEKTKIDCMDVIHIPKSWYSWSCTAVVIKDDYSFESTTLKQTSILGWTAWESKLSEFLCKLVQYIWQKQNTLTSQNNHNKRES